MKASTIAHKFPTYRDDKLKSCQRWLDGKRIDDNAEGLWRIHDKLYDLTAFIQRHPGGAQWLELTHGVDITEQFEIHHITDVAEKLLPKFYVRDAALPRNYKITFHENGFFKTLQKRVANKLEFLDKTQVDYSRFYCDFTLASTFLLAIIAARDESFLVASFAALSLLWQSVIAHNFIHQKDNWRMYIINLSFLTYREWRSWLQINISVEFIFMKVSFSFPRDVASYLPELLSRPWDVLFRTFSELDTEEKVAAKNFQHIYYIADRLCIDVPLRIPHSVIFCLSFVVIIGHQIF